MADHEIEPLTDASLEAALAAAKAAVLGGGPPLHFTPRFAVFECGEEINEGEPVVLRDGKIWRASPRRT